MPRPKVTIEWNKVAQLATTGATGVGIAKILGIAEDTLRKRCKRDNKVGLSDYMQQKRETGFSSLRMKQYAVALNGNPVMLIWLGKQYLGQTDKGLLLERVAAKENIDLKLLTKEELKELERLMTKAEGGK